METIIMMDDKQTNTTESVHKLANEENLWSLFDQDSNLMLPTSSWLSTGITIVINEISSGG